MANEMSNMAENIAHQRETTHRLSILERRADESERCDEKMQKEINDIDKRTLANELNGRSVVERIEKLVTKDEFTPIRMIVYGLATSALTGLVAAILSRVLVK